MSMANGNLNCGATNCVHNNASQCYAGGISVVGSNASSTSATACASFEDRATSSMTNCGAGGCTCAKTSSITCQATECAHNSNNSCKAQNVQINAQDATCETFICK